MSERSEFRFIGVVLGTATGWDDLGEGFQLYEFEPTNSVDLPACACLTILYKNGNVQATDANSNIIYEEDLIKALRFVPC